MHIGFEQTSLFSIWIAHVFQRSVNLNGREFRILFQMVNDRRVIYTETVELSSLILIPVQLGTHPSVSPIPEKNTPVSSFEIGWSYIRWSRCLVWLISATNCQLHVRNTCQDSINNRTEQHRTRRCSAALSIRRRTGIILRRWEEHKGRITSLQKLLCSSIPLSFIP